MTFPIILQYLLQLIVERVPHDVVLLSQIILIINNNKKWHEPMGTSTWHLRRGPRGTNIKKNKKRYRLATV